MKWRKTKVGIKGRGPAELDGQIAECTECGCEEFVIFLVGDETGAHFQCLGCGTVFCYGHPDCVVTEAFTI